MTEETPTRPRIVLPDAFYNITSILFRLGPNRRTNRRALRHAANPPKRGYWFKRCLCAWCFGRNHAKAGGSHG